MSTARSVARDVLVRADDGAYANLVLPGVLRRAHLDTRDRAFVTDLVGGTLRGRRRLDALLAPHGRRRLDALDPPVRAALRLGAYQLLDGVPAHAAVGETVAVTPPPARGYVNGVLRALATAGPPWPEPASLGEALSYPDWIVDRLTADLGADATRSALETQNRPPALTLRPHPATSADALAAELEAGGATVSRGRLLPHALVVRGAGDPAALPAVSEGRATPQDQASQAVTQLVGAVDGDHVVDVASAPGGKATALAEADPSGLVVAVDVHAGRLGRVRDATRRLHLDNVALLQADGRQPPLRPDSVDRALVDAPCSGLGVLRRRAEARWRVQPPGPDLTGLQVGLLLAAAEIVRPGGLVVYSVCTLSAAETTDVADRALDALGSRLRPRALPPPWRPAGPGGLLLPQDADTDGMFALVLERTA